MYVCIRTTLIKRRSSDRTEVEWVRDNERVTVSESLRERRRLTHMFLCDGDGG